MSYVTTINCCYYYYIYVCVKFLELNINNYRIEYSRNFVVRQILYR